MANLSHLISLPLYSIYEVRFEGIVENVLINATTNKIECLVVYDEENDTKKVLPYNKIYSINENALTIKNSSCLNLFESVELKISHLFNPINSTAVCVDGHVLGRITDVETVGNSVENLVINNNKISSSNILSFNNKLCLIKKTHTQKLSNFKIKKPKFSIKINKNSEQTVSILSPPKQTVITPKKAVINYNFLINRRVTKDITINGGEVLVKKDTLITLNLINTVKQYGKIKELTLFSK